MAEITLPQDFTFPLVNNQTPLPLMWQFLYITSLVNKTNKPRDVNDVVDSLTNLLFLKVDSFTNHGVNRDGDVCIAQIESLSTKTRHKLKHQVSHKSICNSSISTLLIEYKPTRPKKERRVGPALSRIRPPTPVGLKLLTTLPSKFNLKQPWGWPTPRGTVNSLTTPMKKQSTANYFIFFEW